MTRPEAVASITSTVVELRTDNCRYAATIYRTENGLLDAEGWAIETNMPGPGFLKINLPVILPTMEEATTFALTYLGRIAKYERKNAQRAEALERVLLEGCERYPFPDGWLAARRHTEYPRRPRPVPETRPDWVVTSVEAAPNLSGTGWGGGGGSGGALREPAVVRDSAGHPVPARETPLIGPGSPDGGK